MDCFGAAITKRPHFLPQNGQKMPFFLPETVFLGPEWAVVGPPTLSWGCWSHKDLFCKVLEQVIECFGAAITKKNRIFCRKMAKKCHFVA